MDQYELLREYFARIDKVIDTADIDKDTRAKFKKKAVQIKAYYRYCKEHPNDETFNLDKIEDYLRKEDWLSNE